MKTKKIFIRVLNTCAAIIIVGIILASISNLIDLNKDLRATQDLFLKQDLAFKAWLTNLVLSLPIILSLCVLTLKKEDKEFVLSLCLIIGFFFTGCYSSVLTKTYLAVGAYIKILFWLSVTADIMFLVLLFFHCMAVFKISCFNMDKQKLTHT